MYCYVAAFGMQRFDSSESVLLLSFDHMFFAIFTISIVINFLTEFTESGETQPNRNLKHIALRYIHSNFLIDILAWVPFHYFVSIDNKFIRWAFLIKIIRIVEGIQLIDVSKMMKFVH